MPFLLVIPTISFVNDFRDPFKIFLIVPVVPSVQVQYAVWANLFTLAPFCPEHTMPDFC